MLKNPKSHNHFNYRPPVKHVEVEKGKPEDIIPEMFREEETRAPRDEFDSTVPQGFYKTLMKHMPEAKQVAAAFKSAHRGPMWDVGDDKWTQYRPKDVDDKDKRMRALVKKMAEAEHPITHVSTIVVALIICRRAHCL